MSFRFGFWGCGTMGQSVLHSWLRADVVHPREVIVVTRTDASAAAITKNLGVEATNHPEVLDGVRWVVLGFKPQTLLEVDDIFSRNNTLISLLAGIPLSTLEKKFSSSKSIRLMPNLGQQIDQGVTAICWGQSSAQEQSGLRPVLEAGTQLVEIEETQFDAFTALAGSGPAYLFEWMQAWQDFASRHGFAPDLAKDLISRTLHSSLTQWKQSPLSAAELADQVTSTGGTTAAARKVLADKSWNKIFVQALESAHQKAQELGKE